jgi:RimJ/RimL family protein N-acetyltransferase
MVFIALDEATGRMLGLVRLKDELDEQTAEFAILVRSRLKGHGLGWLLMQRIIDYAKQKGLRRVYGDVLVENTTMLQMCAELGFYAQDMGSNMRRVVLDIAKIASR